MAAVDDGAVVVLSAVGNHLDPAVFPDVVEGCSFRGVHFQHPGYDASAFSREEAEETPGSLDGWGLAGAVDGSGGWVGAGVFGVGVEARVGAADGWVVRVGGGVGEELAL